MLQFMCRYCIVNEVRLMKIKELAYEIMDDRVKPYLKFDTQVSKYKLFICIFNEEDPFNKQEMGIHLINGEISDIANIFRSIELEVVDKLFTRLESVVGVSDENIIKFFLYHEEHHWLHFLDSGLSPKEYCNSLDVREYSGRLIEIGKSMQMADDNDKRRIAVKMIEEFRANSYEMDADEYAFAKLRALKG